MHAPSASLRVIVGALFVAGSLGGFAGSPLASADDIADTTTTTTTTTTTVAESVETVASTEPATTLTESTAPTSAAPTSAEAAPVAATVAPSGRITINAGASAAPAVPIGQPASASGATPARGTQVQLRTPPAQPPEEIVPADSGSGRRVVYSKSLQRVWAIDDTGAVVKTHRVSGKQTPYDPAPGVYSVWSRSRNTCAIHNPTICWGYMVRFAQGVRGGNIGFHEIPYQYGQPVQTEDQLGEALSGGCVRQAPADAIWMWDWAQLGTVVVVLP